MNQDFFAYSNILHKVLLSQHWRGKEMLTKTIAKCPVEIILIIYLNSESYEYTRLQWSQEKQNTSQIEILLKHVYLETIDHFICEIRNQNIIMKFIQKC